MALLVLSQSIVEALVVNLCAYHRNMKCGYKILSTFGKVRKTTAHCVQIKLSHRVYSSLSESDNNSGTNENYYSFSSSWARSDSGAMNELEKGHAYFVATPLGNLQDITLRALSVLQHADCIVCEDTRHTMKLLRHLQIPINGRPLISHHEHNTQVIYREKHV